MKADRWFTITESAALTGVSDATIRRRVAEGAIPAKRFGPKSIRIAASDLREYIRNSDAKRPVTEGLCGIHHWQVPYRECRLFAVL